MSVCSGSSGADENPIARILAECDATRLGDGSPDAAEAFLSRLVERAREESPLRQESLRIAAVQLLKAHGASSPSRLVNAAFAQLSAKANKPEATGDNALGLVDPEPWREPVEGAEVICEIISTVPRFLKLPEGSDVAIALWILHAHAFASWAISPILSLTSPEKRCGKTTALIVISALVPRSLSAVNLTAATLYRTVSKYRPSLLIDEADTFLAGRDDLRGVINSGHSKAAAQVLRCVGDDHDVRVFQTWCPKAIAMIGKLPETLSDRSVIVPLRRRRSDEHVEKLRLDRLSGLERVRQKAWRWASDNVAALAELDPVVPEQLNDRAADNWRPLLAIADHIGGDWPAKAREAAALLCGKADADIEDSYGLQMLSDIRTIFDAKGQARLSSAYIVAELCSMQEREWAQFVRGSHIHPHHVAKYMAPFGIKPKQLKIDNFKTRGYERQDFEDAWARYLPPQ